jgi:hypothetical protein
MREALLASLITKQPLPHHRPHAILASIKPWLRPPVLLQHNWELCLRRHCAGVVLMSRGRLSGYAWNLGSTPIKVALAMFILYCMGMGIYVDIRLWPGGARRRGVRFRIWLPWH